MLARAVLDAGVVPGASMPSSFDQVAIPPNARPSSPSIAQERVALAVHTDEPRARRIDAWAEAKQLPIHVRGEGFRILAVRAERADAVATALERTHEVVVGRSDPAPTFEGVTQAQELEAWADLDRRRDTGPTTPLPSRSLVWLGALVLAFAIVFVTAGLLRPPPAPVVTVAARPALGAGQVALTVRGADAAALVVTDESGHVLAPPARFPRMRTGGLRLVVTPRAFTNAEGGTHERQAIGFVIAGTDAAVRATTLAVSRAAPLLERDLRAVAESNGAAVEPVDL